MGADGLLLQTAMGQHCEHKRQGEEFCYRTQGLQLGQRRGHLGGAEDYAGVAATHNRERQTVQYEHIDIAGGPHVVVVHGTLRVGAA